MKEKRRKEKTESGKEDLGIIVLLVLLPTLKHGLATRCTQSEPREADGAQPGSAWTGRTFASYGVDHGVFGPVDGLYRLSGAYNEGCTVGDF